MLRQACRVLCAIAVVALCQGAVADDGASAQAPKSARRPSIDDFARLPAYGQARLSPDAKRLAALAPGAWGRTMLVAMDLGSRKVWPVAKFLDADVTRFDWVNDHWLVLFANDLEAGSGEGPSRGFYGVSVDGEKLNPIGGNCIPGMAGLIAYVAPFDDGSNDILVTGLYRDGFDNAFRLDVTAMRGPCRSIVRELPRRAQSPVFDHHQQLRALIAVSDDAKRATLKYRATPDAAWTTMAESDITQPAIEPVAFGGDDRTLYVSAPDGESGTLALFAFDTEHRSLGEKLVALQGFDIDGGLIFSRRSHQLLGIRIEGDRPRTVWFDADMARAQAAVDAALPGTINELSGEPGDSLLVFAHSDTDPGRYFLYAAQQRRLEELVSASGWIKPEQMSPMKAIRYRARDGLTIPAYLTLPEGRPAAKLPLIALIHGGPHARDTWGFNPEVQFLASLGYAVLQPNFRGSTGYGRRYLQAGWRQWGLAMQDDVTDGIEHLAAQGTIDRHRVCIMGASYGGYAALMGLAKEPALFRCGVDAAGPSDIGLEFTAVSDLTDSIWERYFMRQVMADPDTMRAQIGDTSPLRQADRIKAPVLLVYGDKDRRVPMIHGIRMRDALEEHHATYEWLKIRGEAHGFLREENRALYYRTVEQFLRKYNPPD